MEFPEGWGVLEKNPFRGGGMDIFWNYTMYNGDLPWLSVSLEKHPNPLLKLTEITAKVLIKGFAVIVIGREP